MNNIDSQCPRCSGTGYVAVKCDYCRAEKATCGECKGTGNISGSEVVMTTQNNELRRKISNKLATVYRQGSLGNSAKVAIGVNTDSIVALFNSEALALLDRLKEGSVVYHYKRGDGEGYFNAVPKEVVEAERRRYE